MEHAGYLGLSARRAACVTSTGDARHRRQNLGVCTIVTLALVAAAVAPASAGGDEAVSPTDGPVAAASDAGNGPAAESTAACPTCTPAPTPTQIRRGTKGLPLITGSPIVPGADPVAVSRFTRVGERQLGVRLLPRFYATVAMQPNRALDPVPPDVSPTDRLRIGLSYVINF